MQSFSLVFLYVIAKVNGKGKDIKMEKKNKIQEQIS